MSHNQNLLNDLRMVMGLPPYNTEMNYNKGDGYAWQAIVNTYGKEDVDAAAAFLRETEGVPTGRIEIVKPAAPAPEPLTLSGTMVAVPATPALAMTMQEAIDLTESMPSVQEAKLKDAAKNNAPDFLALLAEWEQVAKDSALVQQREKDLRQRIFDACFATPKEGVNTHKLLNGYVLKGEYKVNRTLDKAQLTTARDLLAEIGESLDSVVQFKPDLVISGYKALSTKGREIMDEIITAKPGLPALKIELPKKAVK